MSRPITLDSSGLFSKWGFCDGDVLDDFMYELFQFKEPDDGNWNGDLGLEHCILQRLIEKHLLPLCPEGFELFSFSSCHNPVRACDGQQDPGVSVQVTYEMFKAAAAEVLQL